MSRSLLLLLPGFPLDATSGAARSLVTICRMLVDAGFRACALATTADEYGGDEATRRKHVDAAIAAAGGEVRVETVAGHEPHHVLSFDAGGISYQLLETGGLRAQQWQNSHGAAFDSLFDRILSERQVEIVLTFGALPAGQARERVGGGRGAGV